MRRLHRIAAHRSIRGLLVACVMSSLSTPAPAAPPASAPAHENLILDAGQALALQHETENPARGRYDWGPAVMRDGELYRMWWVRLGGTNAKRFPYTTTLPDGERFAFTYPDWGDRIYYAESRDGKRWNISGDDFAGSFDDYTPDSPGPLMVMQPAESRHEINHLGCPTVVKVDGTFYMFYETCAAYNVVRDADGKPQVRGEFHNQVFLATSEDGKRWHKHPNNEDPQPIISAPASNLEPGNRRYGIGQPSAFYRDGRFVLHVVDSCTGPGDFIVRLEADNPRFENARVFRRSLRDVNQDPRIPAGAVARFAQTDVKFLEDVTWLVRPAYGTGRLGLLATRTGLFPADARARMPGDVFPQIRVTDPRGSDYRERLFPRFLVDPHGEILVEDNHVALFFTSGRGWKEAAHTWDLQRAEFALQQLRRVAH